MFVVLVRFVVSLLVFVADVPSLAPEGSWTKGRKDRPWDTIWVKPYVCLPNPNTSCMSPLGFVSHAVCARFTGMCWEHKINHQLRKGWVLELLWVLFGTRSFPWYLIIDLFITSVKFGGRWICLRIKSQTRWTSPSNPRNWKPWMMFWQPSKDHSAWCLSLFSWYCWLLFFFFFFFQVKTVMNYPLPIMQQVWRSARGREASQPKGGLQWHGGGGMYYSVTQWFLLCFDFNSWLID